MGAGIMGFFVAFPVRRTSNPAPHPLRRIFFGIMALEHTNLTILNPYLLYFSKDGGVDSIVDQWNMELPRERVLELLEYCERYLKNYPTNDHIEFENMKKRGRMDEFERIRLEKEATTKPNKEKREIY